MGFTAPTPALASAMAVAEFRAKADALKAKGVMTLFSSEFIVLKTETNTGFKAWNG